MPRKVKPAIGIIFSPGKENQRVLKIETQYLRAIEKAGGIPLLIPIYRGGLKPTKDLVNNLNGFVFAGSFILENRRSELTSVIKHQPDNLRDVNPLFYDFCKNLLPLIKDSGKPLLGICRGMQAIAEIEGGKVENIKTTSIEHRQRLRPWFTSHEVNIKEGSIFYEILGPSIKTNSFHRQQVSKLPKNFVKTAWTMDGSIEAFESKNGNLILGIQFHPEWLIHKKIGLKRIFKRFVSEAKVDY